MERIKAEELKELGFESAATELTQLEEFNRKCTIAYEHFRYVKPAQFNTFNEELKKKTKKYDGKNQWGKIEVWDQLKFHDIKTYKSSPPREVLDKLRSAKTLNCFDTFEIAKIESHREVPDPILFGCIKGCPDKFFIGQWDNDVKIEDILTESEG